MQCCRKQSTKDIKLHVRSYQWTSEAVQRITSCRQECTRGDLSYCRGIFFLVPTAPVEPKSRVPLKQMLDKVMKASDSLLVIFLKSEWIHLPRTCPVRTLTSPSIMLHTADWARSVCSYSVPVSPFLPLPFPPPGLESKLA